MTPDSVLSILSFIILIAFYIFGTIKNNPYQIHLTTILIEAILILLIFIFNGFIYTRERKFGMNEINKRAQNIIDQLKRSGLDTIQVLFRYSRLANIFLKITHLFYFSSVY